MNLSIVLIALLTAVVALATKIVEYKSARIKSKTETATPVEVTTKLATSKRNVRPCGLVLVVTLVSVLLAMGMLFWSMFSPGPATRPDVFHAALCVYILLQANFNLRDG